MNIHFEKLVKIIDEELFRGGSLLSTSAQAAWGAEINQQTLFPGQEGQTFSEKSHCAVAVGRARLCEHVSTHYLLREQYSSVHGSLFCLPTPKPSLIKV